MHAGRAEQRFPGAHPAVRAAAGDQVLPSARSGGSEYLCKSAGLENVRICRSPLAAFEVFEELLQQLRLILDATDRSIPRDLYRSVFHELDFPAPPRQRDLDHDRFWPGVAKPNSAHALGEDG